MKQKKRTAKGNKPLKKLIVVGVVLAASAAVLFSCNKKSGKHDETAASKQEEPRQEKKPIEWPQVVQQKELKKLRHHIYSSMKQPKQPAKKAIVHKMLLAKSTAPGTVAIIIDDMGKNLTEVNELMAPGIPLTFSVIPGLAKDKEVAEAAHEKGYHVMTHLPMEPLKYAGGLEKNGLLVSQDAEETTRRAQELLARIPFSEGANNHMGSRYTADEEKMKLVMAEISKKGIFFIDSKTSPKSIAAKVADNFGVKEASRNVFLDNVQDVEMIKKQLDLTASVARKKGYAIAICHPHATTIQALKERLPQLKEEGITFVYASQLVH